MGEHISRRMHFPLSAGILLGLGMGGFFDGIVLHQILQWHHMATSATRPYPGTSGSTGMWDFCCRVQRC